MAKHKYRCSVDGHLYDRDEIILEHHLSPICIGCLDDQELLDAEIEPDFDHMRDFLVEVKELQRLERGNHGN